MDNPHLQEFAQSLRYGSVRMARSFIQEEKTNVTESTDEALDAPSNVLDDTFFQPPPAAKSATPPPVDRSTKYAHLKQQQLQPQEVKSYPEEEEEEEKENYSVDELVQLLLNSQSALVERYLDTLDVNERAKVVDQMNTALAKLD